MFKKIFLLITAPTVLFFSGCRPKLKAKDFNKISVGMTKEQVRNQLGEPDVNRGSTINEKGQVVDVWEYNVSVPGRTSEQAAAQAILAVYTLGLALPLVLMDNEHLEVYWLYFINNLLSQWGNAKAWQRQSDHIQEIRIR